MIVRAQPATTEGLRDNSEQMTKMSDRYNDLMMLSSPEQREREYMEQVDKTWESIRSGQVLGVDEKQKDASMSKMTAPLQINAKAIQKRMERAANRKKENGGKWRLRRK